MKVTFRGLAGEEAGQRQGQGQSIPWTKGAKGERKTSRPYQARGNPATKGGELNTVKGINTVFIKICKKKKS